MSRRILFLAILSILSLFARGPPAPAAGPPAEEWATFDKPGQFITALCATDDALWIGTEDHGLWRLDLKADPAKAEAWQQFTSKDTATDHVYAVAVDSSGRVWAGTVNQGVSVYNGKEWRNYGVLDGCSGERVFAIAADPDPKRGSVWIGTDHGLVCWTPDPSGASEPAPVERGGSITTQRGGSPDLPRAAGVESLAKGTWRTYTQADGLPSQQIYAVAVATFGRVWVGTECDGLAWADPPYDKWQPVRAEAEKSGDAGESPGCGGGTAPGLPSNLTNALAVLKDGTTVVATDYGLGIRRAGELAWTAWQGLSKQPYENYARGLAVDPAGGLWIATRHKGLARLDLKTGALKRYEESNSAKGKGKNEKPAPHEAHPIPDDYVFCVAVTPSGDVWAGTYGGGLARLKTEFQVPGSKFQSLPAGPSWRVQGLPSAGSFNPQSAIRNPQLLPLLPAPLGPPTLAELNAMLAALAKVPFVPPEKQPQVVRLDDDWLTKGDCLGRYGRYWGCWCAICSPNDYIWGAGPERVEWSACIGLNCSGIDTLRRWIHWLKTDNPATLEMPPTYLQSRVMRGDNTWSQPRRQAEWDDHGEHYPMLQNGPSLYCTLKIPAGLYHLSFYNFNKDGHTGKNRYRDYQVSIRPQAAGRCLNDVADFDRQPQIAHGRMRDFWGGVYQRYLLRGPKTITIRFDRNHSRNTILAGVFLDLVDGEPVPYFHTSQEWQAVWAQWEKDRLALASSWQSPAERSVPPSPAPNDAEAVKHLFEEIERMPLVNAVFWANESRPFYARTLKWILSAIKQADGGPQKQALYTRASTCYYHLGLYEKWEAGQVLLGKTPARQVEKSLRWDGISDCSGKGNQIVMKAVAARTVGTQDSAEKDRP